MTLESGAETDGEKELLDPDAAGAPEALWLLAEADWVALFCGVLREALAPPEAADWAAD